MHGILCAGRGARPSRCFEECYARRLARLRHALRTGETRISGIAAGARGDLAGDLPGIFEAPRQDPCSALAHPIMTAAAIERADGDLEADASAVARRADGRADHLGSQTR